MHLYLASLPWNTSKDLLSSFLASWLVFCVYALLNELWKINKKYKFELNRGAFRLKSSNVYLLTRNSSGDNW